MAFPLGNISLFNTSHSMEIRPGPVNNELTDMAIKYCFVPPAALSESGYLNASY
jgi:hypothetical protein